jgi:hypothetical protein
MPRPLTFEERLAVTLSLKGERYVHRRWPREVVERFARAGVASASCPQSLPLAWVHRRLLPAFASVLPGRVVCLYTEKW